MQSTPVSESTEAQRCQVTPQGHTGAQTDPRALDGWARVLLTDHPFSEDKDSSPGTLPCVAGVPGGGPRLEASVLGQEWQGTGDRPAAQSAAFTGGDCQCLFLVGFCDRQGKGSDRKECFFFPRV